MEIDPILLSFLSTYILSLTVCFGGVLSREVYTANTTRTKIQKARVIVETVTAAVVALPVNKILQDKYGLSLEIQVAICFMIGFWSDSLLGLLSNKTLISGVIKHLLGNFGNIGKSISKAIETAQEEDKARKENYKLIKKNKDNISEKDK